MATEPSERVFLCSLSSMDASSLIRRIVECEFQALLAQHELVLVDEVDCVGNASETLDARIMGDLLDGEVAVEQPGCVGAASIGRFIETEVIGR